MVRKTEAVGSVFNHYTRVGANLVAFSDENRVDPWAEAGADDGVCFLEHVVAGTMIGTQHTQPYRPHNYILTPSVSSRPNYPSNLDNHSLYSRRVTY